METIESYQAEIEHLENLFQNKKIIVSSFQISRPVQLLPVKLLIPILPPTHPILSVLKPDNNGNQNYINPNVV